MKRLLLWTDRMHDKCIVNTPSNIDSIRKKERDKQTSIVASCIFDSIYRSKSLVAFLPISSDKVVSAYPLVFTPSKRLKFNRGLEYLPFRIKYGDRKKGATTFRLNERTLSNTNYYDNIDDYQCALRIKNDKQFRLIDLYRERKIIPNKIVSRYSRDMYNELSKHQIPCKIALLDLYDYILSEYHKAFTCKNDKIYSKILQIELSLYYMLSVGSVDDNMVLSYYPKYKVSKIGCRLFERMGAQRLPKAIKHCIQGYDYDIKQCGKTALEMCLNKHDLIPKPLIPAVTKEFKTHSHLYGMYIHEELLLTLINKEWSYPIRNKMGIPFYTRKKDMYKYRRKILAHLIFGMEVYALIKAILRKKIPFMCLEHDGFRTDTKLKAFRQCGFQFRQKIGGKCEYRYRKYE